MAKVVWKPVINSAPEIYNFLDAFSLTYTEYVKLLQQYNKVSNNYPILIGEKYQLF